MGFKPNLIDTVLPTTTSLGRTGAFGLVESSETVTAIGTGSLAIFFNASLFRTK
jgi:hypothetical protein